MSFAGGCLVGLLSAAVLFGAGGVLCRAEQSAAAAQVSVGAGSQEAQQAYTLPAEKLAKAVALGRIRNILDIAGSLWWIAVLWLLLATRAAAQMEDWAEQIFLQRWVQGLLFFAVLIAVLTGADLPLAIYGHFIARAYQISVQGWGSWFGDQAKALALALLLGSPLLLLFNWIVRRWPRRYWLVAWAATLPVLVVSTLAEPLLEPIFNQYEPLGDHHPALVGELEGLVARTGIGIPPERMYLMKASEKSNGINAYVTGMGATKRYVLWDTTVDRIRNDEVLFIFGHESGHYVLNHIPKMLGGFLIALFFVYWGCAGFAGWLDRRFGVRWGCHPVTSRAGFVLLLFTLSVAGFLLEPAGNSFSRYFEHEADVYGQEAIHGLVADPRQTAVAAFNDLGEAWLDDPNPSAWIEFWLYSHPSTQSRASFAAHYDPWANGGHGRFFLK